MSDEHDELAALHERIEALADESDLDTSVSGRKIGDTANIAVRVNLGE